MRYLTAEMKASEDHREDIDERKLRCRQLEVRKDGDSSDEEADVGRGFGDSSEVDRRCH